MINQEHKNTTGKLVEHHFLIDDALKFGVEKAVILYNLRFWLDYNKNRKVNARQHTDKKNYFWTYNSAESFSKTFLYLKADAIARHLRKLEEDGIIITNNFNRFRYDRTKWYTIPNLYEVENNEENRQIINECSSPTEQNTEIV